MKLADTSRLFLASTLSQEGCKILRAYCQEILPRVEGIPGYRSRWIKWENWHLTWCFIGETPNDQWLTLGEQVSDILSDQNLISLSLDAISFWPNNRFPKLLVWEGQFDSPEIILPKILHDRLKSGQPNKPFKPHISLARFKPQKGTRQKPLDTNPLPKLDYQWIIGNIQLYQSTLQATGAIYTLLESYPLKPA